MHGKILLSWNMFVVQNKPAFIFKVDLFFLFYVYVWMAALMHGWCLTTLLQTTYTCVWGSFTDQLEWQGDGAGVLSLDWIGGHSNSNLEHSALYLEVGKSSLSGVL